MTSYLELSEQYEEKIKLIKNELKNMESLSKEMKKHYINDTKGKKGKKSVKDSETKEPKKNYGITEKKVLPNNVNEFIKYALDNKKLSNEFIETNNEIFNNFNIETLVARTKVNSIIHNYIKTNNLYANEEKRTEFLPDKKLKELFEMKDNEELNMRNIQSYIKRAYDKFKVVQEVKKVTKAKAKSEPESESEEEENDSDDE